MAEMRNYGLDSAHEFCEERMLYHQHRSKSLYILSLGVLFCGGFFLFFINVVVNKEADAVDTATTITISAFAVVAFGVLMALHRFHLNEISKYEHYKLAFVRLSIATGYESQATDLIISSLITDAFSLSSGSTKSSPVQSPLPGHLGSDLSAILLGRLLDNAKGSQKPANK